MWQGQPASVAPAPLDATERVHALDILRGLALFGMILVHFHQKMRRPAAGLEDLIGWGVYVLVEQKAWATFAFLFGAGFAILLRRLDARHAPVYRIYLRRLAALAAFGVVADVCFGFHILFAYAAWGVLLLPIRRWPTRALLATAVLAASVRPVIAELSAIVAWQTGAVAAPTGDRLLFTAVQTASARHDYLALLAARWALFAGTFPQRWQDFLPDVNLALFIVGLLAVRHRVLDEPLRHVRMIAGWMTFGLLAWAASWLLLTRLPRTGIPGGDWPLAYGFGLIQDQWLCFTYIGAVILLLAYRPWWVWRLSLAGQAGRMALTNYMVQAAVLDALSSGYGFGLTLRPLAYAPAAVLLFGIEAVASRTWLTRFRFGPLEWLWRTITYASRQPLRVTVIQSAIRADEVAPVANLK
jgi:uncharacterized protein